MADAKAVQQEDEFVTVSEELSEPETKIVFEDINDSFTGLYLGMRSVPSENGSYSQARFQGIGDESEIVFFVNANWSLREGLRNVPRNAKTRITFVSEQDTGQAQPMRVYRVEVAKATRGMARRAST